MEVIPFLDFDCIASPGVWYLMSTDGEGPSARVGHASLVCHCPPQQEQAGLVDSTSATTTRVVVVAGATPSGPFNDVYYLELCEYDWKDISFYAAGMHLISRPGLHPRLGYTDTSRVNGCCENTKNGTDIYRPFSYSENECVSNDISLQFVEFSNVHNCDRSSKTNTTLSNLVYKIV